MKPVELEYLIKNGTRATLEQISADLAKIGADGEQSGDTISTAFVRTQVQASLLQGVIASLEAEYKALQGANPDIDQTANTAEAEKLRSKIEELKAQYAQLKATSDNTQVTPKSLPDAQRQFNGLHNSIQQMAREMPSLAMGPQMFFLAISNNLPVFTDELARAKKNYAELIATGQKGTPVWQQVLKSLWSGQTALTAGIMLLVMFGDKIVKSISDMTGWGAAERARREEIKKTIEVEKEAIKSTAQTRFELSQSIKSIEDFNGTKEEERQKIDELNTKYGETFGYYQTLAGWYTTLTDKAEAYANMLILQTKNQSLVNDYIAAEQKIEEINMSEDDDLDGGLNGFQKYGMTEHQINAYNKKNRATQLSDAEAERDAIKQRMIDNNKEIDTIASDNKLNEIIAGSVADLENSIAIKRKALKKLTDPKEYEQQQAAIDALEARVRKITGAKDPNSRSGDGDDLEKQYQTARLASLREAAEAELELERSKISDKIKLIEFERDAQIAAINEERSAYQAKYGDSADVSGFDRQVDVVNKQSDADIDSQKKESLKAELVAHQQYLQEYGTYQQQKYAIAQEYAEKIKNAQTEGERLSLEKELASRNSDIETQSLQMNIDWPTIFGGFGGVFSDMIQPALEDAKKYLYTDDFQNADEASKQALMDAIQQMEESIGGSGRLNFKQLGEDIQAYQSSLAELNDAKSVEQEAMDKLAVAQTKYNNAQKYGVSATIEAAEMELVTAQTNADVASENVQKQTEATNGLQQNMQNTAIGIKGNMDAITNNISQIASGSFKGAFDGVVGLIDSFKEVKGVAGKLADQMDIPLISWILGLLDMLKDGLSDLVGGLIDGIFAAINGIIKDVLSGDLFATIGGSIAKGVLDLVKNVVTLGGALKFWQDESDPHLEADLQRLAASNERLEQAMTRLTDKMDDAKMSEASGVKQEQLDNLRKQEANTRESMSREAAAWTRSGYGFMGLKGKGSSNSKINDAMNVADWNEVSNAAGKRVGSASDFWGLSPEEMAQVADEAGWLYDKIKTYADDGHKNAAKYMDDYIAYAEEREELEKAYYEKLTNTSFDSVRDEFKNALLDMDSDSEDFAKNFSKMMQNAIVESMMTEIYDKKLKDWYRSFGDAMDSNGEIDKDEQDRLNQEYNDIVEAALAERNALASTMGWEGDGDSSSVSQTGKAGAFEAMSQDQGTKLEGLFTANEMRTARIEEGVESVSLQMSAAVGHLRKIEENTGSSALSLKTLIGKIEQIIRDGLKMK